MAKGRSRNGPGAFVTYDAVVLGDHVDVGRKVGVFGAVLAKEEMSSDRSGGFASGCLATDIREN